MASNIKAKNLDLDPEYRKWRNHLGENWQVPMFKTALEFRGFNENFMPAIWSQYTSHSTGIQQTKHEVPTHDGSSFLLTRFATTSQIESSQPLPAWLYFHGGGMVAEGVSFFAPLIAKYAAESGVQVFGVEYRVAPEFPGPIPAKDGLDALKWIAANADKLKVDPTRLGLMGDSAGGGLAAAISLLARDTALEAPIARQILTCPMLDDRALFAVAFDSLLNSYATVPAEDLRLCWEAYVGADKAGKPEADVSCYAAPSRAKDLSNLPPTYLDVGNLDLFRDECADFAARLVAADVDIEFHLFSGLPHGFESAVAVPKTVHALKLRVEAMKQL